MSTVQSNIFKNEKKNFLNEIILNDTIGNNSYLFEQTNMGGDGTLIGKNVLRYCHLTFKSWFVILGTLISLVEPLVC